MYFHSFQLLGLALLLLSYTLILIALLCLPCKIWRSFVSLFFTRLWWILFSFSFHCCPTSCMCCLHCSSRRFSDGSYLGFLFCFCCFFYVAFRKHICFDSEGVTRDRLVFGMLKHGHVSFQILTRYFW